jgi:hypothetical protein
MGTSSLGQNLGKLAAHVLALYDVMPVGWAEHDALELARAIFKGGKTGTRQMEVCRSRPPK